MQFRGADTITHLQDPKILIEKSRKVKITVNMTFKFSLTVSDNLQIFGFFLLKSVSRAKNSTVGFKKKTGNEI
jgi:hypothetical protein